MPSHPDARPLAAMCEDFDSDASETVAGTARVANTTAKRTPSTMSGSAITASSDPAAAASTAAARTTTNAPQKPASALGPDAASDSGYSSHTAATMGSADSAQSYKTGVSSSGSASVSAGGGAAPSAAAQVDPGASPKRRPAPPTPSRTRGGDGGGAGGAAAAREQQSPRKSHSRAPSQQGTRSRRDTVAEDWADPAYDRGRRRPQPAPLQTTIPASTATRERGNSYAPRGVPPSPYHSPPSPLAQRYPVSYRQPANVVQPEPPRRRSMSSQRRPMSYCAGVTPEQYWMQHPQAIYGSTPDGRGPPPSLSAWANPTQLPMQPHQQQPYALMGTTPPHASYFPLPSPTVGPYDVARPLPDRSSDPYSARSNRRFSGAFTPTIIYQDPSPTYPASQHPSARHPSARMQPSQSRYYEDDETTTTSSSSECDDDDEYAVATSQRMPPPSAIPSRHPSMRHGNTIYNARGPISDPNTVPQPPPTPTRRASHSRSRAYTQPNTTAPSRSPSRSSSRRPSLHHHRPKAASYHTYDPSTSMGPTAHLTVGRSIPVSSSAAMRARHRESYSGANDATALETKQRRAEAYISSHRSGGAGSTSTASSSRRQERTYRASSRPRPVPSEDPHRPNDRHRREHHRSRSRRSGRRGVEPAASFYSSSSSSSSSEYDYDDAEDVHPDTRAMPPPPRPRPVPDRRSRTAPSGPPLTEHALRGAASAASKRSSGHTAAVPSQTSSGRGSRSSRDERHLSAPASTAGDGTATPGTNASGGSVRGGDGAVADGGGKGLRLRVEGGVVDLRDLRGRTVRVSHLADGAEGAEFVIGGSNGERAATPGRITKEEKMARERAKEKERERLKEKEKAREGRKRTTSRRRSERD